MKRIFVFMLTVILIISVFPVTVYASHEHNYAQTVMSYNDGTVKKQCACGATKNVGKKVETVKLKKKKLVYNGTARRVTVIAKNSAGRRIPKEYYTVKYDKSTQQRKSYGKYSVTVKFKKPYSGKKKLSYYIVGKNQKAFLKESESNKAVFYFSENVKKGFIQFQIATDKKYKNVLKKCNITKKGDKSIKGIHPDTLYYYRTRRVVFTKKGTKIYGNWSKKSYFWSKEEGEPIPSYVPDMRDPNAFVEKDEIVLVENKIKEAVDGSYVKLFIDGEWIEASQHWYYYDFGDFDPSNDVCYARQDYYQIMNSLMPGFIPLPRCYAMYYERLCDWYRSLNISNSTDDLYNYLVYCRWLRENTRYRKETDGKEISANASSIIDYGASVCFGFATLTYDFCWLADIPCFQVIGGNHVWNYINLNGYWYFVDNTGGSGTLFSSGFHGIKDMSVDFYKDRFAHFYSKRYGKEIYDNCLPRGNKDTMYNDTFYRTFEKVEVHTFLPR